MKFFYFFLIILNCYADEVSITSLGNGACWYQANETLKLSSFNDRYASNMSYDDIQVSLKALLPNDHFQMQSLYLHCGSFGASLVARFKNDNGALCLWAMPSNGKWKIRSLGATLDNKKDESRLCDGFKQGELLAVLKNHDLIEQLKSEKWNSVVLDIIPVAFDIYKIRLTKEYFLREEEVAKMLLINLNVVADFNFYQHGVGEYVQLK